MSSAGKLAITGAVLAGLAVAQPVAVPLPSVESIEPAVNQILAAIRAGNVEHARTLMSEGSRVYSPGGVALGVLRTAPANFWRVRKSYSFYVRHIQVLTAESALVVGLWRSPGAPPPQDAGMFDWTMRLEPGGWKVTSWREAYVPSPYLPNLLSKVAAVDGTGVLTPAEIKEGWQALFDGTSSNGWVTVSGETKLLTGWRISDGSLATVADASAQRMAIRTREEFTNFDLKFEWQVTANANSGCQYRLYTVDFFGAQPTATGAAGLEYQIADDDGDRGARIDPRQKSGALYAVVPVLRPAAKPVGEWNESRIVVTSEHIEHWLNGVQTAQYSVDVPFASPILLQHHASEVRFRKLRIHRLP